MGTILRQDDLLSPLLFILVMEVLRRMEGMGYISGLSVGNGLVD